MKEIVDACVGCAECIGCYRRNLRYFVMICDCCGQETLTDEYTEVANDYHLCPECEEYYDAFCDFFDEKKVLKMLPKWHEELSCDAEGVQEVLNIVKEEMRGDNK